MRIPKIPKTFDEMFLECAKNKEGRFLEILRLSTELPSRTDYLHWDELRHRGSPKGFSSEEWWLATKFKRKAGMRNIPLKDKDGKYFQFSIPDSVAEHLHQIDQGAGCLLGNPEPVTNPHTRDRYLMRSLIEEAITSSQLEGAATTREVAKEMLSSGRKPKTRSERMILNNYLTMQRIRELKDTALTSELVLEIHRMVGEGALDNADGAGRLRKVDETIDIVDNEGNVLHVPPNASELPHRLEEMCRFANTESPDFFIHPVIRAILLHFWLAYDHPFVDGNGRTARALFYWAMLRNRYWLFEFISISEIILKAPIQYGRAFLFTETDENDLTYFIVHQADVIQKAVKALHLYINSKTKEVEDTRKVIDELDRLNYRQEALLVHALRHPGHRYTVAEHQGRHGIAYATARADVLGLANRGLLQKRLMGKEFVFVSPQDLAKRIKSDHSKSNSAQT